MIMLPMILGDP